MLLSGILNVNKPAGWTSFDVVGFVRGRSGVRRVGHAGTLDPAAEGVLPVLLGQATRLTEYLVDTTKTYRAQIQLGVETNTYDLDGDVLRREDASGVTLSAVEAVLAEFRGEIDQVPPAFSAIKRDGVPLYKQARRGEVVELTPRRVLIERIDITAYEPPFLSLEIECGKGFYVRSLAHDIGGRLGVGGTLAKLVRSRVGPFRIEDAVDIETLRGELADGTWEERLYAPDEVLLRWRAAILGADNEARLRHGQDLRIEPRAGVAVAPAERCRAYNSAGEFLAVLRCAGSPAWRPEKVFV